MRSGGISTLNMAYALRASIASSQLELSRAQTELASGRHADVGLTLGPNTGRDLLWRTQISELQQFSDRNKLAGVQADVTQSAFGAMRELANTFLATLAGARNAFQGQEVAKSAAKAALEQLTVLLNTSHDGQYLFGGTNSATPPIADYATGGAKTSVDTAFAAAFGFAQNDPAAVNITPANMQTFLDNQFASLFNSTGWSTDWSSAADELLMARVDSNQRVPVNSSANSDAIRKLAQAITMVAELGAPALNRTAFESIADKALGLTGAAVLGIGDEQARLGISQNEISTANERIELRLKALTEDVQAVESVDKYEAATRVNSLMTQLETAYSLTGRISRLSLLNYI